MSTSENVDIVIIFVFFEQELHVAQDAINYVNASDRVYLFARFRPNDVLTSKKGAKINVTLVKFS